MTWRREIRRLCLPWLYIERACARRELARQHARLQLFAERNGGQLGLLFGLRAIARFMGLSRNQARALIAHGAIPTFTIDGVLCARKAAIRSHIVRLEEEAIQVRSASFNDANMEARRGNSH